ncbi:expressed unknown protein [Seminavis robusta]|uniref:Uncharacterized protein n=1 Tax=Seminavis robusta TaxID=568900 RepID=A0A9N8HCS0_9STRA|nr:expressed unknown protein [Seminavis robusta]|eukprot:Sro230_g093400.1 n/a (142) ;mRNA; r:60780-61205
MSDQAANKTYDKHVQEYPATKAPSGVQISWMARLAVFIAFPSLVGCLGLYMGYLESRRKPERKLSMEVDFIMPFLLALSMPLWWDPNQGIHHYQGRTVGQMAQGSKKESHSKGSKEDLDDQVVVQEEEETVRSEGSNNQER